SGNNGCARLVRREEVVVRLNRSLNCAAAYRRHRKEYDMKISTLLLAATLALGSGAALAFHCPADMKAIDAALPKAKVSAQQMAEVKKLRAEGETLHKAGKHQQSVDTLGKAKKILGI